MGFVFFDSILAFRSFLAKSLRVWTSSTKLVRLTLGYFRHGLRLLFIYLENVPKGANDRPTVDVVIADSGEVRSLYIYLLNITYLLILQLPVESEGDANGKEVPAHAEL